MLECAGNGRAFIAPRAAGIPWKKGAVGNAAWSGVPLATLLAKANPKSNAKFLTIAGADSPALATVPPFIRSIPLDKALDANTILALKMNRVELPVLHGGPARLILPGWYGQNWIKWVVKMTLTETEDAGFFMKKGYRMPTTAITPETKWDSATGTPIQKLRVQSFIASPHDNESVLKKFVVQGKAFSGTGFIDRVEVSQDRGKHWQRAAVDLPHKDGGWQGFSAPIIASGRRPIEIWSRATDSEGNTQPLTPDWNPAGYLYNAVDRISVKVVEKLELASEHLFKEKCLTCHAQNLIAIQRLNEAGWNKVLDKMEKFGVETSKDERAEILAYLKSLQPIESTNTTEYGLESSLFAGHSTTHDSKRGAALYKTNCATCHGENGIGDKATRLRGRRIPDGSFEIAVTEGRGGMPSFSESLDGQAIGDIRSYLE